MDMLIVLLGLQLGAYRRLRPLSTRRFGQPRRLGSRRASSPSGARAGGLSVKPCACSPAPLPPLLLPSFRRALPLTSWSCSSCPSKEVYSHDGEAFWVHFRYFARGLSSMHDTLAKPLQNAHSHSLQSVFSRRITRITNCGGSVGTAPPLARSDLAVCP